MEAEVLRRTDQLVSKPSGQRRMDQSVSKLGWDLQRRTDQLVGKPSRLRRTDQLVSKTSSLRRMGQSAGKEPSLEKELMGRDLRRRTDQSVSKAKEKERVSPMMVLEEELMNHLRAKLTVELPRLAELSQESGPIDFNDWMIYVQPYMADLTATSERWWELTVARARDWYSEHMLKNPIERLTHEPRADAELCQPKWSRLERRASAMLLKALPDHLREEVISSKSVTALGMISKAMLMYQPGGMAEKSSILAALESPAEASSISSAVLSLRKWMRWKRRATEIGVSIPDATILVRGLSRLMRKIVSSYPDLSFRLSLVRNTLLIDTVPRQETVNQYAEHLLAELEQLGHQARKKDGVVDAQPQKLKKFEESAKGGEGKTFKESGGGSWKDGGAARKEGGGSEKDAPRCKFYLTDQGCKKGRECKFVHQSDDKKRCYACGSVSHLSPSCPIQSNPKAKTSKKEESPEEDKTKRMEETSMSSPGKPKEDETVMVNLLEEANRMLKSISGQAEQKEETSMEKLASLQAQLNQLKLKTLKLTRISEGSLENAVGLIDSGATHPLRPLRPTDDLTRMRTVNVTLANGGKTALLMSTGKVMVTPQMQVEPIVPMGRLMQMGCKMTWDAEEMTLHHPWRGRIKVKVIAGCPQVSRQLALELIGEMEHEDEQMKMKLNKLEEDVRAKEGDWLLKLVEGHPVLSSLPQHIRDSLVLQPGEWSDLPMNRHQRKRMKKNGMTCHLFAGKKEGFTLHEAAREVGIQASMFETDILRGMEHDLGGDSRLYKSLLQVALDGKLKDLIAGPPCRTRSVLRHYFKEGAPRPVRAWGGEEFGLKDLSVPEREQVELDDVLMWRLLFLWVVSDFAMEETPGLLVEQPDEPEYRPEAVSFWRTKEWQQMKSLYGWKEQMFQQGDFAVRGTEAAKKPTRTAGNIEIELPKEANPAAKARGDGPMVNSKELARWQPNLMRSIAQALWRKMNPEKESEDMALRRMSWQDHVSMGHIPFRRDCLQCQEAAAKGRPHRKVRHPWAGTLSVDVTGPLRLGEGEDGQMKYILVGAYTWLKRPNEKPVEEAEEDEELQMMQLEDEEVGEEDADDERADEAEERKEKERREDWLNMSLEERNEELKEIFGEDATSEEEDAGAPEKEEVRVDPEIEVFRLAIPLATKGAKEVLAAISQMYLQLRICGFPVRRLHTDCGGEFRGPALKSWCATRDILRTTTSGDDSQANGRAERAIQQIKSEIRRVLHASGWDYTKWPLACHYVHQRERRRMSDDDRPIPTFGQKVLVKKRHWHTKELLPTHEKVRYLAPAPDAHGHMMLRDDDTIMVAPYFIEKTMHPPESPEAWIGIVKSLEEEEDSHVVRRRLREKTSIGLRKLTCDGLEDDRSHQVRVERVLQEEGSMLLEEKEEDAMLVMQKEMKRIKQAVQIPEEEVLRTRIVSPKELLMEKEKWHDPIQAELNQVFKEREALQSIRKPQLDELRKNHRGRIDIVPSKVVNTLKPGPRRKIRLVACGNFVEKSDDEKLQATGADAVAVRYLLKRAAEEGWTTQVLDIRVAFLHAPLDVEMVTDEQWRTVVVLKPPPILIRLGYFAPDEMFLVKKAIYGLRQSPRCWSLYRDDKIRSMESPSGIKFMQSEGEPNLWRIEKDGELQGLMLIYVDDILISGEGETVKEAVKMIQDQWTTSTPEVLGSTTPVKFLGMELYRIGGDYYASQENFIQDHMKSKEVPRKKTSVPCGKNFYAPPPEENITPELIHLGQKVVGELLWLVTRTRPDIAFATSKLSQSVLSAPRWVAQEGEKIWQYVLTTADEGLKFSREKGVGWGNENQAGLEAFSDSSFSPHGEPSHGCVVIMWNGSVMAWRSSRQPFPALSTSESELLETIESMVMADAFESVIAEHEEGYWKSLLCDNMATVSLLSDGQGGWRTRHLRLRAQHLKWRVSHLDWRVRHVPGSIMVADVGTKALPLQRLQDLKKLLGLQRVPREEEKRQEAEDSKTEEKIEEKSGGGKIEVLKKSLQVITLASMIRGAKGQGNSTSDGEAGVFNMMVFVYTLLVVMITLLISWLWRQPERMEVAFRWNHQGRREDFIRRGGGGSRDSSSDRSIRSSELSWSVDDQGREVLRPSSKRRATPGMANGPRLDRDGNLMSNSPAASEGSDAPMTPKEFAGLGDEGGTTIGSNARVSTAAPRNVGTSAAWHPRRPWGGGGCWDEWGAAGQWGEWADDEVQIPKWRVGNSSWSTSTCPWPWWTSAGDVSRPVDDGFGWPRWSSRTGTQWTPSTSRWWSSIATNGSLPSFKDQLLPDPDWWAIPHVKNMPWSSQCSHSGTVRSMPRMSSSGAKVGTRR